MNKSNSNGGIVICKTRRQAVIVSLSAAGVLLLCALCYQPIAHIADSLIPDCILARFGLRCALCGGTRCAGALFRLDILRAVYYNPLVTVTVAIAVYVYLRLVISCLMQDYTPYRLRISRNSLWVVTGILVCFTILRNMPFYSAVLF